MNEIKSKTAKTKAFLNPDQLLRAVPLKSGMTVVDFGCGNGYYAVAAGAIVGKKGRVFALDIMEDALSQASTLARMVGLRNVSTEACDLEKFGSCKLPDTVADMVIIASLLHQAENKDNVIREAYRVLKTGGHLLAVEWNSDALLGPAPSVRISEKQVRELLEKHGLRPAGTLPAGAFHYALLYSK